MSAVELAELLNKLAKDEMAYNKYFAYKTRPLAPHFEQMALRSYTHPNVLCRYGAIR